ncbi:MAG: ATPase [Ignavibacteria bacterium]|nr:ATPase [Ignavibacteria bacterium]
MKKRIAIPTSNGLLDEHFGHCQQFTLLDIENGKISSINETDAPPHQPGLLPPWLAEKGVTDVIAGGMGQRAIELFNQNKVNVFVGAPKLEPEKLAEGLINNTLSLNANYCDH